MSTLTGAIRSIPLLVLVLGAIVMALAPFGSKPHLIEKWSMLFAGTLRRPLDWGDLILHSALPMLLMARIVLEVMARNPLP
jgi:hypothetical protein